MLHRPSPRTIAVAIAGTAAIALMGCSPGSGSSSATSTPAGAAPTGAQLATVVNCGRELSVSTPPSRVLIGYPTIWKTLDALGVGDSVAGYLTGGLTDLPAGADPSVQEVSSEYHVPRETLLTFGPDLTIFSSESQVTGENGDATVADLAAAGIPAFMMQGNCLDKALQTDDQIDTVYSDIEALGILYDRQAEAASLADQLKERVRQAATLRGDAPRPRTAFIQVFDGTVYALGLGNYAAVIDAIGAENHFADILGDLAYVEISMETALSIDADHLVVVHYNDQTPDQAVEAIRSLLPNVKPVEEGHVIAVHTDNFQVGGVPLIDVTVEIAEAIYR